MQYTLCVSERWPPGVDDDDDDDNLGQYIEAFWNGQIWRGLLQTGVYEGVYGIYGVYGVYEGVYGSV